MGITVPLGYAFILKHPVYVSLDLSFDSTKHYPDFEDSINPYPNWYFNKSLWNNFKRRIPVLKLVDWQTVSQFHNFDHITHSVPEQTHEITDDQFVQLSNFNL